MCLFGRHSGDWSLRPGTSGELHRVKTAGMKLKEDKCAFLLPSVTYLGHVISAQGLHTEDSKVKAVVDAPAPRDVTELRSFLGMVNYYGISTGPSNTVVSIVFPAESFDHMEMGA